VYIQEEGINYAELEIQKGPGKRLGSEEEPIPYAEFSQDK